MDKNSYRYQGSMQAVVRNGAVVAMFPTKRQAEQFCMPKNFQQYRNMVDQVAEMGNHFSYEIVPMLVTGNG